MCGSALEMHKVPCSTRWLFYYYLNIMELAAQRWLFARGRAARLNGVAVANLIHTNHLQGPKALLAVPCLLFRSDASY